MEKQLVPQNLTHLVEVHCKSFAFSLFPSSIRALFGTDNQRNAVHGSDSFSSAVREIHFFFPEGKKQDWPHSLDIVSSSL